MAWSVLQSASADNAGGTALTVTTPAFTSNLTAGGKLIAFVSSTSTTTISSVKDSSNNSFSQVLAYTANASEHCWIYVLDTPGGDAGSKPTVTATFTGTQNGAALLVQEITGLATGTTAAAVLDATAGTANGSGTSFTWSFGAYTSTAASEYLVAFYCDDGDNFGSTNTTPSGWTADTHNLSSDSNNDLRVYYKNSTGGAETVPSETVSGPNTTIHWETVLVAFKLATATPPPFYPSRQPARAKLPQGATPAPRPGTGRIATELASGATGSISGPAVPGAGQGSYGAPVRNPGSGPVFRQATQPCRPRIPLGIQPPNERVYGISGGAPVRNPAVGASFRSAVQPARARVIPQQMPLRGRAAGSPGIPVRNPAPGPAFTQKTTPVRFVLPPWHPRAGRVGSSPGVPSAGPAHGPVFRQATAPVRARIPQVAPRGRCYSSIATPVRNPAPGPVFTQKTTPARFRIPSWQPRTGRVISTPASVIHPLRGPPLYSQQQPGGVAVVWAGRGRAGSSGSAPVANPAHGPVFRQATAPVRARIPQVAPRGRVTSGRGAPFVRILAGPPVYGQGTGGVAVVWAGRGRAGSSGFSAVSNPAPGPVFTQKPAVRARITRNFPRAGTISVAVPDGTGSIGGALQGAGFGAAAGSGGMLPGPFTGPVFTQATQPAQARLPWQPLLRGRAGAGGPGAPLTPAVTGPVFTQATQPAQARLPWQPFRQGRVSSGPGAPVRNPGSSAPLYGQQSGAVAVIWAGRGHSGSGAVSVVSNPPPAPVPASPARPVRARALPARGGRTAFTPVTPAPPGSSPAPLRGQQSGAVAVIWAGRGRAGSSASSVVSNPPPAGPSFASARQPARAKIPPRPRGRSVTSLRPAAPVINPVPGTSGAMSAPVRAALPVVLRGTVHPTPPPTPVSNPVPSAVIAPRGYPVRAVPQRVPLRGRITATVIAVRAGGPFTGPAFTPARHPARVPVPQVFSKGRVAGSHGAPVRNPATGPVFRPAVTPARARQPLPRRGRVFSGAGTPAPVPAPLTPARHPARAPVPQVFSKGRVYSSAASPVANPSQGPVFRQATRPASTRFTLPLRGRAAGNGGAPVANPVISSGPPLYPLHLAVRIVPPRPPRGRISSSATRPAANPGAGPPLASRLVRPRIPQLQPRAGRVSSNPGAPILNPVQGAAFRQATQALRAALPVPLLKGRTAGSRGAPVANPTAGAAFTPVPRPVRAPVPQTWSKGRAAGSQGIPFHPAPAAFACATQPARTRIAPPPRGRTAGNPGIPFVPAPPTVLYPQQHPARIIPALPLRGRTAGNRGTRPVNPTAGIPFRQAVQAARAPVPQNGPRGRVSSGPGAPVTNKAFTRILISTGDPFTLWATGDPFPLWQTGDPFLIT